jgi:hypothetical protein
MTASKTPRRVVFAIGAGLALVLSAGPASADTGTKATAVEGKPLLMLGAYDIGSIGYQQSEYFVSGTARSYRLNGTAGADGAWSAVPDAAAPFTTRIVVLRPSDPAKFNGTVVVEWLNVTAGQDTPADWMVAHREMVRKGYAYVAVSAQKVGVEGGGAVMQQGGAPLKKADPTRYGGLSHPGDAFSFDIFSKAGALVKGAEANGILGGLKPQRVLGAGESQSAAFLTTYVNAIDPLARVYDGFFVHSRFGSAAALDGSRMEGGSAAVPAHVRFRADLRVPVVSLITETDLMGGRRAGYHASRTPDTAKLRVWELAGAAHADNYLFGGSFIDSGAKSSAELAQVFAPTKQAAVGEQARPVNPGMPHHYVAQAALAGLDSWVRDGHAPAHAPQLKLAAGGKEGETATLARDAHGIAIGGVRTPWTDVPTVRLSGEKNSDSFLGLLVGVGEPFDKATLARLYPGGKADYMRRFTASLDAAIHKGFILADDRQEILEIAAINFDAAASASPAIADGPAAAAPAGRGYSTAKTSIGTLLADPDAKVIIDKHMPGFSTSPQIEMAKGMTFQQIQQFAPDRISAEAIARIDADLAKLPLRQ